MKLIMLSLGKDRVGGRVAFFLLWLCHCVCSFWNFERNTAVVAKIYTVELTWCWIFHHSPAQTGCRRFRVAKGPTQKKEQNLLLRQIRDYYQIYCLNIESIVIAMMNELFSNVFTRFLFSFTLISCFEVRQAKKFIFEVDLLSEARKKERKKVTNPFAGECTVIKLGVKFTIDFL